MQIRGHSDSSVPAAGIDAPYYRDFIAKRPVVIKNILQTTASVDTRLDGTLFHGPIGNYSAQHNIVQTSGRNVNNKYFVEAEGVGFGKAFDGNKAVGRIYFLTDTLAKYLSRTVTITSTNGTSKTYLFENDAGEGATGTVAANGMIIVQLNGHSAIVTGKQVSF